MPDFDFDIDLSAIEEAMRSACHGGPSFLSVIVVYNAGYPFFR